MHAQSISIKNPTVDDTVIFFGDLVSGYLSFEKSALYITHRLSRLTPVQIDFECQKLRYQRDLLRQKDSNLFQLLELAGQELKNHALMDEYRVSFSRASMACDMLKEELELLRIFMANMSP